MSKSNNTNSLKLSYKNEVHRIGSRPTNLKALAKTVKEVFPDLSKESDDKRIYLKYEDAEGDMIVIATEEDYLTALASSENEGKSLKIYVSDDHDGNQNTKGLSSSSIILNSSDVKEETNKNGSNKRDIVIIEDEKEGQQPQIISTKTDYVEVNQKANNQEEEQIHSKEEKELDKLREITRQTLQEEIPTIAVIIKQLLEEKIKEKESQPKASTTKAVHHGVRCDICGVAPIVGNRYKCTVLADYDLCEDCEAKADHPYPLLKLKNESQKSVRVSVVLPQHVYREGDHNHHWRGFRSGRCNQRPRHCGMRQEEGSGPRCQGFKNLFGGFFEHLKRPEESEKISKAFKDGFEAFKGFIDDVKVQFESSNPARNDAKDNSKEEKKQEVSKDEANAQEFNSNFKDNKSYIEEESSKKSQNDSTFVEQLTQNPNSERNEKAESKQKEEEGIIKVEEYSADVISKAKVVIDIFPQVKFEDVCQLIKQSPSKSVDELVQDFLASL